MRTPTTAEIRTAIQVLKKDGEHITPASSGPPTLVLPQRVSWDHCLALVKGEG